MSSGGYGSYESAAAIAARLHRDAELEWGAACAERQVLLYRERSETRLRGALGVTIGAAPTLTGATTDELTAATRALRRENAALATALRDAVLAASRRAAERYRYGAYVPDVADVVAEATVDSALSRADGVREAWRTQVDREIADALGGATSAGIDLPRADDLIARARAKGTLADARVVLGSLHDDIARGIEAKAERDATLVRQLADLAHAAAIVALEPDDPLPGLDEVVARVAGGDPLPEHELEGWVRGADLVEARARESIRALNTETSREILIEAFAGRGYRSVVLETVLVVENGQLVERGWDAALMPGSLFVNDDDPTHAVRLRLEGGEAIVEEVRIAPARGDALQEDLAFEESMCAVIPLVAADLAATGSTFSMTMHQAPVQTISRGAAKAKAQVVTTAKRHQDARRAR